MATIFRAFDVSVTIDESIIQSSDLVSYDAGEFITLLESQPTYGDPAIVLPSQTARDVVLEVLAQSNGNSLLNEIYQERTNNNVSPHRIVIYDGARGYITVTQAFLSSRTSSSSPTEGATYNYTFIHYENLSFKKE
ncbi:MAG: hypothetical protein LBE95_03805 [Holosporaceae bacterium]|jgi:hypothetical protein|nr:hypothetical protein [Holosporaceae bacterium]